MKSKIFLLLALSIAMFSCTNESAVTIDKELSLESMKRSINDIYDIYSAINTDDNYVVKKYEKSLNGVNPSINVAVKGSQFGSYNYLGKTQGIKGGYANTYIPPSDFDEVYEVNNITVGKGAYNFSSITPIELSDQGSTIASNQVIEWNLAEQGTTSLGNIILVIRPDNSEIDEDQSAYEAKVILTEDDGSYTVSAEDLAGFPKKLPLVVTAVRGDYTQNKKGPLVGTVSIFHTGTLNKI